MLRALPLGVILPALGLVVLGLFFIYSASTDFEMVAEGLAEPRDFHIRQAAFACAGLLIMLTVALTPPRWLASHWYAYVLLGVAMLAAVALLGRSINGATRWIMIGPFGLQLSEFCKPLMIVALAGYLRFHQSVDSPRAFLWCVAICTAFIIPILLQPDAGTAMVFIPVAAAMIWCAGGNRVYMVALGSLGAAALPTAFLMGALEDHQMKRIETYLASFGGEVADRTGDGYQLWQSITAVGSGGFSGEGYGLGMQAQLAFLPEAHNDFIFAIYAQEMGLIGVAAFIALYFFMLTRVLRIARSTRDPFSRLVVVGVAALLFTQAAMNLGVVSGALPVTGVTLPFVSYGGSSLLAGFASLGLVCNIAIQPPRMMGKATF